MGMLSLFGRPFSRACRYFTTVVKTNKSALSELRKKTGFTFSNCKKALELFENDIGQAEEWLHREAQKEGWARVGQLHNRPMSQGLIGIIHEGQRATLIEVNCETDFVAKNDKFQQLVSRLANVCHGHLRATSTTLLTQLNTADTGVMRIGERSTVSDMVATDVGVIGENMVARRVVHMCASPGATLSSYTHIAADDVTSIDNCNFGKYATLVEYRPIASGHNSPLSDATIGEISLGDAARKISQHIAGMNPTEIGELCDLYPEEPVNIVGSNVEDVESNLDIMFSDVEGIQGNSYHIDVEGTQGNSYHPDDNEKKLEVAIEYDERETINPNEETEDSYEASDVDREVMDGSYSKVCEENETALLRQKFLLDESITVADFLRENNMEVLNFVRFECGEELVEDKSM